MTHAKKPFHCPHCGHSEIQTALRRTHCPRCGKPLKTKLPILPEVGLRARPLASL